jgi:adenylate cyclase
MNRLEPLYQFGGFTLERATRTLLRGDGKVDLRPKSFDVLCVLLESAGAIATRDKLIQSIWPEVTVTEESLSRCISDIRLALGDHDRQIIKTIPGSGYLLTVPVAVSSRRTEEAAGWGRAIVVKGAPDRRARVAVLAFDNLSGDPDQLYFGDGIVEDIITALSRFRDLVVVARNSSFRYRGVAVNARRIGQDLDAGFLLKGSIRRSGDRVRLNAQLIDSATGGHLWAERYDREIIDILAVQDEIAGAIAAKVAAYVTRAERDRTPLRPHSSTTYDEFKRAAHLLHRYFANYQDIDVLYQARAHLERAITADPTHARSYAALAESYIPTYQFNHDADFFNPAILERMKALALKAIERGPDLPEGHSVLGHILLLQREHDASIAAHERALSLNPNHVNWRFAIALVFAGEHERAIEVTHACMRLDPFYSPVAPGWLGIAHFMLARYSEALPPLLESTSRASDWRGAQLFLTATYARLGALEKARAAATEMLRLAPAWTISGMGQRLNLYRRSEDSSHLFDALRLAGLPE